MWSNNYKREKVVLIRREQNTVNKAVVINVTAPAFVSDCKDTWERFICTGGRFKDANVSRMTPRRSFNIHNE